MRDAPVQIRSDHNTGDYVPYSYQIVSGFFNVPYYLISNKGYETGPPVYSPYPRRLESLTICRWSNRSNQMILEDLNRNVDSIKCMERKFDAGVRLFREIFSRDVTVCSRGRRFMEKANGNLVEFKGRFVASKYIHQH